ncbi:HAD family phosphatase [Nocardiopsis gilva YIM 90087]|uniref:HAD family phosphatase n=1 Tax=Nocardiopsis gilva YIM 90087 TaxID=1235441 RepID=A0A223S4W1_9ACTN|nr:HAD family phosphatase [Nocardiopsis gilva]ASU83155.1 HAD family phosphatase [Nocardiopsis gilva YIM 90087]
MAINRGPTPLSSPTTAVFDYGEVISRPQLSEARDRMERIAGVDPRDFWTAYWDERSDYDGGLTSTEYWDRISLRLGAEWDGAQRQDLWATDVSSWLHVTERSAGLVDRLADRGVRLALLSNAPADIAGALRHSPVLARFDALFFSCDLGIRKPAPDIYTHVLTELGVTPEETVFIDDREENVLAAKRLGIDAYHHGDADDLESFLTERFGKF